MRRLAPSNHWILVLLGLLAGCSGKTVPHGEVQGRVTLNGQPVTFGTVVFRQVDGPLVRNASLEPDGTYVVRAFEELGLPVGTYRVTVSPISMLQGDDVVFASAPLSRPQPSAAPVIPKKYLTPESSGLKLNVVEGQNRLDVELK